MVLWTERFLRNLNEAENWYQKSADSPDYLEALERRIKCCEADIKSEKAWEYYLSLKSEIDAWYASQISKRLSSADPLDELIHELRKERLKAEYLEKLFFALKEVARLFALETYETPEVSGWKKTS